MRTIFFAGAAALLCASAATAADVAPTPRATAVYAPAVAAAPINWAGFYVGADVSYDRMSGDATATIGKIKVGHASASENAWGALGFAGYNWQFGRVVVGPEVEVGFNKDISLGYGAKARLGYAFDRFMPYVAAGGSCAKLKARVDGTGDTYCGWTAGGGIEMKLTEHWLARVEATHRDFGTAEQDFGLVHVATKLRSNEVNAGLAYRF